MKSKLDFAGQQVVLPQPQEQSDDSLIDHYTVDLHTPVLNKVRVRRRDVMAIGIWRLRQSLHEGGREVRSSTLYLVKDREAS